VSDAEAAVDRVDEQGSPEALRDDYEDGEDGTQALAILNSNTEESSAVENGVEEESHNTSGGQGVENEGSYIEETITFQAAENREETGGDFDTMKLIEAQQGIFGARQSGEDEDDDDGESVTGNTEHSENGSKGM
jgi:hypothetical protein